MGTETEQDPQDYEMLYDIVYSELRAYHVGGPGRKGLPPGVIRTRHITARLGSYTLAQAHTILDLAADAQDAGLEPETSAAIVPRGDPFGTGDPWDLPARAAATKTT